MANFSGGQSALPGTYSEASTLTSGTSSPATNRVASIIGLGARSEVIISSALGGGLDGLDGYWSNVGASDGRHFALSTSPIISNRTQLFKKGVLLQGTEDDLPNSNPFSDSYDYRIDITSGDIELQTAHLVDQGGTFYTNGVANVGVGTLTNLSLVDVNANSETWTIKCVSVQRNNLNQPIPGTAVFVAFGSVSGNVLNANGSPATWIANNTVATNSILSFSIFETLSGLSTISPFRQGDYFTIEVASGVLSKNDSLTASYIAVADINNPTFYSTIKDIQSNFGLPSLSNTLSLGCQLAFANSTPGIMCVEAAPSLPRRISYELETAFPATSTNVKDFQIPLPLGVTPDVNSAIHVFVTNPNSGVETQLLPNMFPFFTLGTGSNPSVSSFVFDNANPPAGNSFSYSVLQEFASLNFLQDGYVNRDLTTQINATLSSASVSFNSTYVGKFVSVIDAINNANVGTFAIVGVVNGALQIRSENSTPAVFFSDFVNDTSVSFQLINPLTGLVVAASSGTDGTLLTSGAGTAQGTFNSTAVNFSTLAGFPHLYLKVTSSTTAGNVGLFDILSYSSGPNTLTIAKTFVSEHSLKIEVIDPTQLSSYLILNHNVVPLNNSLRVTIVDTKDASFFDAGWEKALASLEPQEIDILVPLPLQTISVIFQNALSHCQSMSSIINRKERVLYVGAINGLTPANLTGAKLAAVEDIGILEGIEGNTVAEILAGNTEDLANYSVPAAFGDTYRCVYFFPDQIVVQVGTSNQIIDGFYLAAAGAGYTSGQVSIPTPLTNKILSGFTILNNRLFTETVYRQLASAGVTSLIPVAGGGSVRWGLTTTQSGFIEEQEISIVFIRDAVSKSMRTGFAGFIGNAEDNDSIGTLTSRAVSLLNSFIGAKLITAYTGLSVSRDLVVPTQFNVVCLIQPTYPINTIFINISVGIIG